MRDQPAVEIDRVWKRFGQIPALRDVSMEVAAGRFFALLGPSGCGKTTLMRLIAGFERPDEGVVRIDGVDMADVPPEKRPVNMMFQSYALFPHMSVAQNVGFGLRRAGLPRREVEAGVAAMLRLVQMQGFETRKPAQLSGGQRQRVALARALARRPRILLLDEPMAALDRKLREETQFALKDIQRELGTTFLVVTHDQDEAMGLADNVALMREGRIEQIGSPADLYGQPATRFVARFIGETNLIEGVVRDVRASRITIETADGVVVVRSERNVAIGASVAIAVRPERLTLASAEGAPGENAFRARLRDRTYRGATTLLRAVLPSGAMIRVACSGSPPQMAEGEDLVLFFAPDDAWLLDDEA